MTVESTIVLLWALTEPRTVPELSDLVHMSHWRVTAFLKRVRKLLELEERPDPERHPLRTYRLRHPLPFAVPPGVPAVAESFADAMDAHARLLLSRALAHSDSNLWAAASLGMSTDAFVFRAERLGLKVHDQAERPLPPKPARRPPPPRRRQAARKAAPKAPSAPLTALGFEPASG